MAEKPILFSTPMIQAILEGRKTQTRRAIKPQPTYFGGWNWKIKNIELQGWLSVNEFKQCLLYESQKYEKAYKPGDILWVRETWREHSTLGFGYIYKASYIGEITETALKWRSPVNMPPEAARIFLRVTDVRVERVQDISLTSIEFEGFDGVPFDEDYKPKKWFINLWNFLNAKSGYGWDVNPWVFVYEFERIDNK